MSWTTQPVEHLAENPVILSLPDQWDRESPHGPGSWETGIKQLDAVISGAH